MANAGDYNGLRRAAMTFARNGMDERCEDVVAGMRELAKRQSDAYGKRDTTATDKVRTTREERRRAEFLPTDEDQTFVKSLMVQVTEPGKYAGWIAPPARGINNQPVDFEYVKLH